MPRYKPLKFIPQSYDFSTFDEFQLEGLAAENAKDAEDFEMEQTLVGMLKALPNDRYRALFLLQILRHDGYKLPHEALYKDVFKIHRSWYFRMINRMRKHVQVLNQSRF